MPKKEKCSFGIKSRYEWGAIQPPFSKPYFPHVPNKVIFHHYGFPEDEPKMHLMPFFEGAKSIKELQKEDITKRGLIDIKFHYIIAPNGDVYEGRPDKYIGRGVYSYDNGAIQVLVWGNFNVEIVPYEVKESIVKLLLFLREKYKTIEIPKGIYGHSCKNLTSCPGYNLSSYIKKLRR